MKVIFDDETEVELNKNEQVVMSAMLACYAAAASQDMKGVVTTVAICEIMYPNISKKVAKEIGAKLIDGVIDSEHKTGAKSMRDLFGDN